MIESTLRAYILKAGFETGRERDYFLLFLIVDMGIGQEKLNNSGQE